VIGLAFLGQFLMAPERLRVPLHLLRLVQVQRSGEPVLVHRRGLTFPPVPVDREPEDDERARITPGCAPDAERGTRSDTFGDPETSASWSSGSTMTCARPRAAAGSLVERDLQVQGSGDPPDQQLPGHPDMNAAADLLIAGSAVVGLDQGPRVGRCLQDAGYQFLLVPAQL